MARRCGRKNFEHRKTPPRFTDLPVPLLDAGIFSRLIDLNRGVVEQNVYFRENAQRFLDQVLDRFRIGHVGFNGMRLPSDLLDALDGFECAGEIDICHNDQRAFARKLDGRSPADAGPGPGNDGNPIF